MLSKIIVELTPREAELFKRFKKNQSVWEKVFETRGGRAILHFDEKGLLRKVEVDKIIYKL